MKLIRYGIMSVYIDRIIINGFLATNKKKGGSGEIK